MKLQNSSLLTFTTLGAVFLTTACSSIPKAAHEQALSVQEQQYQQELVEQRTNYEKEINVLKTKNSTIEQRAEKAEALSAMSSGVIKNQNTVVNVSSELFPPNAKPGQCWSRVLTPASYVTNTERVMVKPATESIAILPAKYTTATERVLVKEETTKIVPAAATYKMVTERVMVKPAHTHLKTIPAQYETVTERVLDKPAHTAWKRGAGFQSSALDTRIDNGTGEIMCLVEVPASYKTVTKTVLKTPERVVEEQHEAEYKTITKRVVDKPASTKTVIIPAEYKVVNVERLVTAEKEVRKAIPAVYKNVTSSEKISDEKLAWEEVLCEVNMDTQTVAELQRTLKKSGSYTGPIDGLYGPLTERAANSYAKKHGLPTGSRLISLKTVKHLGLNI